jgi:sulfite exporter TauE/SafE
VDAGSAILAGLVLGLSSGGHCFWSCAAVLGPYLLSTEDRPGPRRWSSVPAAAQTLVWYNAGRLVAYLAVGLLVSWLARSGAVLPPVVQAAARLATAVILGASLFLPANEHRCWGSRRRSSGALAVGLLQGLSPCPPFLAAVGIALSARSVTAGVLLFLFLFVGTALFTLPLAFLEPLRRRRWLTWMVRGVGVAVCGYLLIGAVLLLVGKQ